MAKCLLLLMLLSGALTAWAQETLADSALELFLAKSDVDPSVRKMAEEAKRAVAKSRWTEAAQIHERLYRIVFKDIDYSTGVVVSEKDGRLLINSPKFEEDLPWRHAAGIGWLYLLDLNREQARKHFEKVLSGMPHGPKEPYLASRSWAAAGLVRLAEMEGRFGDIQGIRAKYDSGLDIPICGTCIPTIIRRDFTDLEDDLEKESKNPSSSGLHRIRETARKLGKDKKANISETRIALRVKEQSSFLLAELHSRVGRLDLASKLFSELVKQPAVDTVTLIQASSYLRHMRAMKAR